MSQHGWVLSSSDDDDCVIAMDTSCHDNKKIYEVEEDYYLPLSKRLKMPPNSKDISSNSDDNLPTFPLNNKPADKSSLIKHTTNILALNPSVTVSENLTKTKTLSKNIEKKKIGPKTVAKEKLDAEKQLRKTLQNHIKTLRPAECLKYITCQISDLIPSMFDAINLLQQFTEESTANFELVTGNAACIKWKRKVLLENAASPDQYIDKDERELAVLINSKDFVAMVWNQHYNHDDNSIDGITLSTWLQNLKSQNPDFKIHPIVYGLKEYRKKLKRKQRADFKKQVEILSENSINVKNKRKPKKKNDDEPLLLNNEINQSLVELQVMNKMCVKFVDSAQEFVMLISQVYIKI